MVAEWAVFRSYIGDALHVIESNTKRVYGGSEHAKSYSELVDLLHDRKPKETAEEIIARFNEKFLRKDGDDNAGIV